MIKDKGNAVQLDVVMEKYSRRQVRMKGPDGKPLTQDGYPVNEYVEKYIGFYTLPTTFLKEGITLRGVVADNRNRLLKTRSTIFDKYSNKFYVVNHSVEEIEDNLNPRGTVGFQVGKK